VSSRLVVAFDLIAGQVGARQLFWFNLTDDMLDLDGGTMPIPAELASSWEHASSSRTLTVP
jgi:hypothetical protein